MVLTEKKYLKNENPKKVANIVEKILNFNEQQKREGLSRMLASRTLDLTTQLILLTPKKMLQRLPIKTR